MDKHGEHLLERARFFFEHKKYPRAEAELSRALVADPNCADAHALLARCQHGQGRHQEAYDTMCRAVSLSPEWDWGHYFLAVMLTNLERLEPAETEIREALRLDPNDATYDAFLSYILRRKKKPREALTAAEAALQKDPQNVYAHIQMANAFGALNRWEDARQAAREALRIDPMRADAHLMRAIAFLNMGNPEQLKRAQAAVQDALAIDPTDPEAQQVLSHIIERRINPPQTTPANPGLILVCLIGMALLSLPKLLKDFNRPKEPCRHPYASRSDVLTGGENYFDWYCQQCGKSGRISKPLLPSGARSTQAQEIQRSKQNVSAGALQKTNAPFDIIIRLNDFIPADDRLDGTWSAVNATDEAGIGVFVFHDSTLEIQPEASPPVEFQFHFIASNALALCTAESNAIRTNFTCRLDFLGLNRLILHDSPLGQVELRREE
ncbi:MAG: tetratricopeptide repeat protein [Lentisphaerae bacterium]|nr:tetratricopeptide repeat protein [Lentisphaerota bacterium]